MDGWCVYILECADASYYTGITNDLARRTEAHNTGAGAKYTKGRGPVRVVYTESCADRGAASKREYALKALSRAEKEALILAQGCDCCD